MKSPYSYCVLRYRHDPLSGEFANVAVLICSPEAGYVRFQGARKWKRLKDFFGKNMSGRDLYNALRRCETQFERISKDWSGGYLFAGEYKNARGLAECVIPIDDSALQWSNASGGFSDKLDGVSESLYHRFIGRFETTEPEKSRNDKQVWDESLGRVFIREKVISRLEDVEINAPHDSYHFQHAWKNGQWHLFEPVSLDLLDAEAIQNKALRWFGRSAQLHESADKFKLHLLLGEPRDDGMRKPYIRARDVINAARGVNIVEEKDIESFGVEYASLILAH